MAAIAINDANAGTTVVPVAANGGGDTIASGTRVGGYDLGVVLIVRNGHTSTQDVTVEGQTLVTVAANGGVAVIPVISGGVAYGKVRTVTYSGVTALTVAAWKLGVGVG